MKIIDDKRLKDLRKTKRVKAQEASSILATKPEPKKAPVPAKKSPDQINQLIVTVSEVIKTTVEMNQRATDLLNTMFIRVSAQPEIAPPVVNMSMPEPAKKWRFTVTKRDRQGLLEEVEADRLE